MAKIPKRINKRIILYGAVALFLVFMTVTVGLIVLAAMGSAPVEEDCVGVVRIEGEITTQGIPETLFEPGKKGSEDMAELIDEVNEKDHVKSVVFIIDSPGGSVFASKEIYDAVERIEKPKVAYFRETAASGAYYVASGTDYIVSDSATLTGSIGVVSMGMDLSGLFENLGVNMTIVKTGDKKDIGGFSRKMTEEEREIMQEIVDEMFAEFRGAIIKARGEKLDSDRFGEVLDGRILTGKQAYEIGLVDELGGKDDAVRHAANMAGIEDEPKICELNQEGGGGFGSIFEQAGSALGRGFFSGLEEDTISVRYQ